METPSRLFTALFPTMEQSTTTRVRSELKTATDTLGNSNVTLGPGQDVQHSPLIFETLLLNVHHGPSTFCSLGPNPQSDTLFGAWLCFSPTSLPPIRYLSLLQQNHRSIPFPPSRENPSLIQEKSVFLSGSGWPGKIFIQRLIKRGKVFSPHRDALIPELKDESCTWS